MINKWFRYVFLNGFLITLLIGVYANSYSQSVDFSQFSGNPVKVSSTLRLTEPYFYGYSPQYLSAAFYKASDQFKFGTIEDLMTSYYSSDTKDRLESCFISGKALIVNNEVLKKRSTSDTLTNYFALVHKLEFQHEGKPTAIVKYFEVKGDRKEGPYSIQAQQVNGRWYITNEILLNDIEYIIRLIKTDSFWLIKSNRKQDDKDINYIIENSKDESKVLNITKLAAILREWDEKNYTDKLSKICDI